MASSSTTTSSSSSTASTARSQVQAAKRRKGGRAETTSKAAKISPSSHPQQQQEAVVRYMPMDIVFKVMCTLPPRYIARCRCVCKQWRSLTYDRDLIKQHQSVNSTDLFLLFPLYAAPTAYAPTIHLYRLGDDDRFLDCSFHLKVGHLISYQLSNSVNGLVCAFDNRCCDRPIQYLLNPFMRDVAKLPPSTSCSKEMWNSCSVGLGFDVTTGAYKVVRLFRIDDDDMERRCGCEVLSVGPNQDWQYVGEVLCRVPWLRAVFFKGAILWPVQGRRCATRRFPEPCIMEFGLKDHKLRLIPTPKPMPQGLNFVDLLESEGHLCLAKSPSSLHHYLTIWRLEDHPSHIWTKTHSINMSSVVSLKAPLPFVGIRGHEILVDVTEKKEWCLPALTICSYDLHTNTLREVCRNYRAEGLRLGFITESLVSPRSLMGSISH